MNAQSRAINKQCPRCYRSDFTDFSTCRYCNSPYGGVYEREASGNSFSILTGVSPTVIIVCALFLAAPFAAFYLQGQGGDGIATTSSYSFGYHRRARLSAIPAALLMFAGREYVQSQQDTADK